MDVADVVDVTFACTGGHVKAFVERGGVVIAQVDALRQPFGAAVHQIDGHFGRRQLQRHGQIGNGLLEFRHAGGYFRQEENRMRVAQ